MTDYSRLLTKTMTALQPFIIVFGIYVILNGHITPGGGFQGGAILASCFIVDYIIHFRSTVNLSFLTRLEKVLYFTLASFAIVFVLYSKLDLTYEQKGVYLIVMNCLIGIKVCCGLTVIFFRFILFESR